MIFTQPLFLIIGIPLSLLILYYLLNKEFVAADTRFSDEKKYLRTRKRNRTLLFISRGLTVVALLIALAGPMTTEQFFGEAEPEITLLFDRSASMNVFDLSEKQTLQEELGKHLPVRVFDIGHEYTSELAETIIPRIRPGGQLILISDGHTTSRIPLSTATQFALQQQATIHAYTLPLVKQDAALFITGPSVVIEGANSTFTLELSSTHGQDVSVQVSIDDQVLVQTTTQESISFSHAFSSGTHQITAQILEEDDDLRNNKYVHTVRATTKPLIAYVATQPTRLYPLLQQLYQVQHYTRVPQNLDRYYALVLDNIPIDQTRQERTLTFVRDGGGLVVVGGEESFEYGRYRNSLLEQILPVHIGTGANQRGGANIIVAIDMSGSTQGTVSLTGERVLDGVQDLQRALAIDFIQQLNPNNNIGVLGFSFPQPTNPYGCTGACVIQPVQPLGVERSGITQRIATANITGNTAMWAGIEGSMQLLQGRTGRNHIILVTDGLTGTGDLERTLNAARTFAAQGGSIHIIHTRDHQRARNLLQEIATAGGGNYFSATSKNRLSALFGEPMDVDEEDAFSIVAFNEYHFITESIQPTATLFGYNQVVPKQASQLLVTSVSGEPVLTIWNYGIGRVATITGYTGGDLGELLSAPNSQYISRTVNWAIGNPQRLEQVDIRVTDAWLGEDVVVNVTSTQEVSAEGIRFSRIDANTYQARIRGQEQGIFSVLNRTYAVNYPREISRMGLADALEDMVLQTGGRMFTYTTAIQDIIAIARDVQEQKEQQEQPLAWLFLLIALIIFAVETCIRRLATMRT